MIFNDFDGWTIGDPDLIVTMQEPYHVTDDVYDLYTAFTVDLTDEQLPEDMYITAFQCKPDSKVIHHFNCHLLYPDKDGKLPPPPDHPESSAISPVGAGQYLGGISSGSDPVVWPEGFGIPLKKGTRVTFDIHYHKEPGPGTGVYDQSSIGFALTKEKPTRVMGGARPLMHFNINIEPGDSNYQIGPISQVLQKDIDVVSLMPHMHIARQVGTLRSLLSRRNERRTAARSRIRLRLANRLLLQRTQTTSERHPRRIYLVVRQLARVRRQTRIRPRTKSHLRAEIFRRNDDGISDERRGTAGGRYRLAFNPNRF